MGEAAQSTIEDPKSKITRFSPHREMDTAAAKPPAAIRWIVAFALLLISALLVFSLLGKTKPPTVQALALLHVALATYAWTLYPAAGSVLISLVVLACLVWAWALQQTAVLGELCAAFGALLAAATWQLQLRARRLLRIQQLLNDLTEERAVKGQAIAAASQMREALQKKLSRYTQLQAIAEELSSMTDLASVAALAVERAFALIGKSDACLLLLVNRERQELSLFASKKRESVPIIRAKHGDQFDRHVLRTHRPLLVNDVRRDFRFTVAVSPEREISSVIACPLLVGQSPGGLLRLDSSKPGVYTQDDLRFLDILLDLISTAVTNAKLFAQTQQLAMTDGLTGLTLRRPFLEQLTRELTRAVRSRDSVSVLLIDVDHFKTYNDTFGHTAGDLVLRGVADVLRASVPSGGMIGRYGGEEFVVLLPRHSRLAASDVAEKIRRMVEQQVQGSGRTPAPPAVRSADPPRREQTSGRGGAGSPSRPRQMAGPGTGGGVTVSLGIATFPDDAKVELELLRVADQRLYQAKHAGRNLVCSS